MGIRSKPSYSQKEIKMSTNRIVLVLGVLALLLVGLAVSQSGSNTLQTLELSWPPRPDYSHLDEKPLVSIPDTDFYQRHPEWMWPNRDATSDFYQRHPEWMWPNRDAASDYFQRHPELMAPMEISADLTAYHLSERTLVDPNAGLAIYLQSEHTLVDPQAGLAIYQQSKRTSVPVRFNKYQRSEWFGK
jgi:hypothetical protein